MEVIQVICTVFSPNGAECGYQLYIPKNWHNVIWEGAQSHDVKRMQKHLMGLSEVQVKRRGSLLKSSTGPCCCRKSTQSLYPEAIRIFMVLTSLLEQQHLHTCRENIGLNCITIQSLKNLFLQSRPCGSFSKLQRLIDIPTISTLLPCQTVI